MNVETIYKTSEEKFVGEYVVYLKEIQLFPGAPAVHYTYADPECTAPIFSEQFHKMMHNNVRLVVKRTIEGYGYVTESSTAMSSGPANVIHYPTPEGVVYNIMAVPSVFVPGAGDNDPYTKADINVACLPQDMYELIFGGALPMALNEDDEPVSAMEALRRLFVAYIAYMEERNDAE